MFTADRGGMQVWFEPRHSASSWALPRLSEGQANRRRLALRVLGVIRPEVRCGGRRVQPGGPALGLRSWAKAANRRELAVERAAKKEAVEQLHEVFKTTGVAVVAHYSGLTVAQMQNLRKQMKQAGASVKVSKNRLAKIALEGTDVVGIGPLLKGPTVIATSNDPVAAPKVAIEFAKANEKFVILGGSMGSTVLNVDSVKALASLPSLDELRGKLVGLIQAPATKLAQLANAPAAKVARVIQAHASKGEAA